MNKKKDIDIGFRCFRLEDKDVQPKTTLDMLFEIMIDLGYTLDLPLETTTIGGDCIYNVNQGELVVCFTKVLTERETELIIQMKPKQICVCEFELSCDDLGINKLRKLAKEKLNWDDTDFDINFKTFGDHPIEE